MLINYCLKKFQRDMAKLTTNYKYQEFIVSPKGKLTLYLSTSLFVLDLPVDSSKSLTSTSKILAISISLRNDACMRRSFFPIWLLDYPYLSYGSGSSLEQNWNGCKKFSYFMRKILSQIKFSIALPGISYNFIMCLLASLLVRAKISSAIR